MKNQFLVFSIIFSMSVFISPAFAQLVEEDSLQKSIQVEIEYSGEVNVTHELKKQNTPQKLDLLAGTVTNLKLIDEDGKEEQFASLDGNSIMILPTNKELFVKYDLSDALILQENLWTWNVLYLHSTSFIFPEEVDLIFVNDKPVKLGDKPGIMCHGCQMKLEYSLDEPRQEEVIKNQDEEYLIEIMTWAEINQFGFDKENGISINVEGEDDFVTVIVPKNFLAEPYEVYFNSEKIFFHKYIENSTHVWLNLRPDNSGLITITGTVIPEFVSENNEDFPIEYLVIIVVIPSIIVGIVLIKKKR